MGIEMNKENKKTNLVYTALRYREQGFSVIPIRKGDKKSLISWKEFQERKASEEEIRPWFTKWPDANIGIITGKVSGIIVVDVEKGGRTDNLSPTLTAETGGGGFHFYYQYPGEEVPNATRIREKTDIRGDGGYVVAPPSLHKSGNYYQWAESQSPENTSLAKLPKWILSKQRGQKPKKENLNKEKVCIGTRNDTATSVAGRLLRHFPVEEWEDFCWMQLQAWNLHKASPPLEEKELRTIFDSVAKKERARKADPDAEKPIELETISIDKLLEKEYPESEWIVEKLIPSESITVLAGAPGHYKTWIALELALSVASGRLAFGKFKTIQGGVLIVNEEDSGRLIQKRLKSLGEKSGLPISLLIQKGIKVDQEKYLKPLLEIAQDSGVKLVIFDSFTRIHTKKENEASEMAEVLADLKKFNQEGIAVLFTHHLRKQSKFTSNDPSQRLRGSSDILAAVDCSLFVERRKSDPILKISQEKLRTEKELVPFGLCFEENKDRISIEYQGEIQLKTKLENVKEGILKLLGKGEEKDIKEIEKELKSIAGKRTITKAREELEKGDKINSKKERYGKKVYTIQK